MNTIFFLYIFAFLTGTVIAHDVPPIVREVLTKEELQNTQESKRAFLKHVKTWRLGKDGSDEDLKALGFALQNDEARKVIFQRYQQSYQQKEQDEHSVSLKALCLGAATGAVFGLACVLGAYHLGHAHGYYEGLSNGYTREREPSIDSIIRVILACVAPPHRAGEPVQFGVGGSYLEGI